MQAMSIARIITSQKTKFAYVVEKLPEEVDRLFNAVSDENSYDMLRQTILHRTDKSEEKKLSNLF